MSASEQDVRQAIAGAEAGNNENNPWPRRLDAWKKFSEKLHERGSKIEARYEDERDANNMTVGLNLQDIGGKRVNLFYSNVTVIKESLYNSLPKPDVSRLHKGDWDNEAARVAATIVQRGLTYEVNCAPNFDDAIKAAVLDRLVPGIGQTWVEFHAAKGQMGTPGYIPESISLEIVYWKDFLYEPARNWSKVGWAGRKIQYPIAEAKEKWGDRVTGESQYPATTGTISTVEQAMKADTVCILQIWDKRKKTVIHMTEGGHILDETPDPLKLKDFYPFPKPLMAAPPTRYFLPLADYYMAQDQYIEMDILYARINLIIEAIRVAGVYDSTQTGIQRMLGGTENKLIPVDNWALFADKGGLKGTIDWFPVETVATVLQHLVTTYSFIKTQLFEVTGMADIVRGSTNQYETAAAQQIKAQFASVRMNAYQRDTATFVRDTVRIMAEMMCQLYTKEKLSTVCGQLPQTDQQYVDAALAILRNDFMMHYNVSIQADSLTQADWGLEQQQRMTYVQALAQFLTSAVPAAQADPTLQPLLAQMIKFASVGFKGSTELEGTLDHILEQMAQQPPQQDDEPSPEEKKAQAEAMKAQQDMQMKEREHQLKMEMMQAEMQHKQAMNAAELDYKRVAHAMDLEHEQRKFAMQTEHDAVKGAQQLAIQAEKAKQPVKEEK